MCPKRWAAILAAGLKAAEEQIQKHPARTDYPRDYNCLYGWLEDKLFNLYEAIQLKEYSHVWSMVGEIIITASEIADFAEFTMFVERIEGRKKQ